MIRVHQITIEEARETIIQFYAEQFKNPQITAEWLRSGNMRKIWNIDQWSGDQVIKLYKELELFNSLIDDAIDQIQVAYNINDGYAVIVWVKSGIKG
jgi:hypothetical protein